jgi:hypothetical protein
MGVTCSIQGAREIHKKFVRKSDGKGEVARPTHRWKDETKMDIQMWIRFIYLRKRSAYSNKPYGLIKD